MTLMMFRQSRHVLKGRFSSRMSILVRRAASSKSIQESGTSIVVAFRRWNRRVGELMYPQNIGSLFVGSLPLPLTPTPEFIDEYPNAKVVTKQVPGPQSLKLMNDMDAISATNTIHFFVDYSKSRGNYIVDVDGNCYLDVLGQIASLPIGYNHPSIIKAMTDPENIPMLVQRPCLGLLPPKDWTERIQSTLMKYAPPGLTEVHTMMCGSCSNENAFKAAFIWYQTHKVRGGQPPSQLDLESCMMNQIPGAPKLSVLSFNGGFHGRLMGCMSATHSKAIHKVDIPAFDYWPVVDFPKLTYPLNEFENENRNEEARCLAMTEEAITKSRDAGCPVAAMIVEPIQAEGGDNHASADFFRKLRDIAANHDIAFIVDEVQTGGGSTGTFWAHEQWKLENPPDIVTFSKKMQTGGYYTKPEFRPKEGYRIFNTWMGDPSKIIQLEAYLDTVEKDALLENTCITGDYLLSGLETLQGQYPNVLSRARGAGTYCAIDLPTSQDRDSLISLLRHNGVECAGSGDVTLRLRPALIFQPRHAAEFLNLLEQSIQHLK